MQGSGKSVIMSRTGNALEVVVYERAQCGQTSGFATFPPEEAALSARPLDWQDADDAAKAVDPNALKVAPYEPVAAVPIGGEYHGQQKRPR
jgi:hypothetical protein